MGVFWHWFIAAGTLAFTLWCVWLVRWAGKQGPSNKSDEELVGHTWDGDIAEWNRPAPRWWLHLYFITIAFAIIYMIAYPGLGAFDGLLGWSQEEQYEQQMQEARERYEPIYERYASMPWEELKGSDKAQDLGAALYASYCTTCHGSDARGATGFPNLTDDAWLYGKSEQALTMTLENGRSGVMPALGSALGGDEGIDNMVTYVRSLSGLVAADADTGSASQQYAQLCSACHGANGKGNQQVGAPNLTDDSWLYGSSASAVRHSIVNGRNGVMPPHGDLLGENRLRILAAWVAGLPERQ